MVPSIFNTLYLVITFILYFATSILVRTRIVQLILQFWYGPELFPVHTILELTRIVRKILVINLSVPELLIQAILGHTRIVREYFTGQLNDADCQVLCQNAPGSSK